jgi:uncharacterized protein (TIGR03437 family)
MKTAVQVFFALGLAPWIGSAQPVVSAVLNAASYDSVVSPASSVAIFGSNLAPAPLSAGSSSLPLTLGGVSISVAGLPARLFYVSPNQINLVIPSEVMIPSSSVVPVVVTSSGGTTSYNIRLTRNGPGIFTRNGSGTGRALLFDSNFQPVDTVVPKQALILYATGLGLTSGDSGRVVDEVEVYIGERKAQVLFAGLAAGFPGIYQLNVIAPVPATDRLYLRSGGWQSNIVDIGIRRGTNTSNVKGAIEGLHPSSDPSFRVGTSFLVMLHAGAFTVSFDVNASAGPFDVAAVGEAGSALISIDPASPCDNDSGSVSRGAYTASISTVTAAVARGDFSGSVVPLWDYLTCDPRSWECLASPLSTITQARLGQFWIRAAEMLPAPNLVVSPRGPTLGGNGLLQIGGCLVDLLAASGGSQVVIDGQKNRLLSTFGGIVQLPLGAFMTRVSTFKLYVDGVQVASKDVNYVAPYRP